jgi:hypothetical protein
MVEGKAYPSNPSEQSESEEWELIKAPKITGGE